MSGSYAYSGKDSAMYISMTESHKELSGYIQVISSDQRREEGFTTRTLTLKGTTNGRHLNFSGGALSQLFESSIRDCSGSYSGTELSLAFPLSDGRQDIITFSRVSVSQWNKIVERSKFGFYRQATTEHFKAALGAHVNELKHRYSQATQIKVAATAALPKLDKELERQTAVLATVKLNLDQATKAGTRGRSARVKFKSYKPRRLLLT